jgi:predicted PhzF superfamily epimerase YddE/YHI9
MIILKVFVNEEENFGNPVGIILDLENNINQEARQKMAIESRFSEIVFINNLEKRDISIFSPTRQIPFAGHAVVGVANFLIHEQKLQVDKLVSMNNEIRVKEYDNLTWVEGKISILPKWNFKQLSSSVDIEQLTLSHTKEYQHTFIWAWIDEDKGIVRARTFATDWEIPEDEANGSGSMKLAYDLKKSLTIIHGKGSIIHANYINSETAEIGGLVKIEI